MEQNHVALFSAQGTAPEPNLPALLGGHCKTCGGNFFPMQSYGCERCGSCDVEPRTLSGRGRLVSSAEVHMSQNPHRPAPYTVGAIALDEGGVVRALLDVPPGTSLALDTPMVTKLVPETRPNAGEFDLRFVPASTEG